MALVISDDALRAAGLSEEEALIEFGCRLFDAGKLTLHSAAKLTGLSRGELEQELRQRKIAVYRPRLEDLHEELAAMDRMGV